jgi:DNA-binding SARP family transcriptional activator
MGRLDITLFGQFRVQRGGQALTSHYPPKLQELLGYLLVNRDRAHSRETIASVFWGNHSTARSKKYLRQTLWQLQTNLHTQAEPGSPCVLLADADTIRLNPAAELWLDVAEFERAFARAQNVPGQALDAVQVRGLRAAVELYRGDLLANCLQDWCLFHRERLQNLYLSILDKLMRYSEAHGEYDSGLLYGAYSLRCDRARERTHRQLMRLYHLAGDRTSALRQYDRCVEALSRELAAKPAASTVALYEQIRSEQGVAHALQHGRASVAPMPSTLHWTEMLKRLMQLQADLAAAQDLIARMIHIAEASEIRQN